MGSYLEVVTVFCQLCEHSQDLVWFGSRPWSSGVIVSIVASHPEGFGSQMGPLCVAFLPMLLNSPVFRCFVLLLCVRAHFTVQQTNRDCYRASVIYWQRLICSQDTTLSLDGKFHLMLLVLDSAAVKVDLAVIVYYVFVFSLELIISFNLDEF